VRRRLLAVLVAGLAVLTFAQTVLNNDAIIKMAKAGLGETIIVSTINSQPGKYSTSADDLIALKSAGVTDKVIQAMITAGSAAPPPMPAGAPPAPAGATAPPPAAAPAGGTPTEVGVYFRKSDAWADLNPEVVNFKTGGVLKGIATAGIVKGDINGHVNNAHSPNHVTSPVDLLVYTPEGTAITEYQLLRLHDAGNAREFRTMTGGVFHASGGATRDLVEFEGKKVAPRTYEIQLTKLTPGDYGLLPPSSGDATGSTGRVGKIYSFRILE
jgi:hypothetical protein